MIYDLLLPSRIVFGAGRRLEAGNLIRQIASRAVVISGSRKLAGSGMLSEVVKSLESSGVNVLASETISQEPTTDSVDNLIARLRNEYSLTQNFTDLIIIAIGGGSAIDLAKSVAAMLPQQNIESSSCQSCLEIHGAEHVSAASRSGCSGAKPIAHTGFGIRNYLEGVGTGATLTVKPLPIAAIPTTAGTGAEATKNAVIASSQSDIDAGLKPFKKSLRNDGLLPCAAIIDPELALSCPKRITTESGMDTVAQLFESYVSKRHQPFTDALIEQGLLQAFEALPKLVDNASDIESRGKMAHASLLSGIALANAGLGMVHGVAPALGAYCGVSHGGACALMLPVVLRVNADVCEERYGRLGRLLLKIDQNISNEIATNKLIEHVENLCNQLGTPRKLSDLNIDQNMIPIIAQNSKGSSMSGNPKNVSEQDVTEILMSIR